MNTAYRSTCSLSLSYTHTNTHTLITALSFVHQINISDTNKVSSGEERFILKCENIPGRKRQIHLRIQIQLINHTELGGVTVLPFSSFVITPSTQQLSLGTDTLYARQLRDWVSLLVKAWAAYVTVRHLGDVSEQPEVF